MADRFRPVAEPDERDFVRGVLGDGVSAGVRILEEAVAGIPDQVEQRRQELREDEQRAEEVDLEFQRQLNELSANQLAELQSDLRTRRDSILDHMASLDPNDPGDAEVLARANAALAKVDRLTRAVVQAQSAEGFRSGEFQRAVGEFGEAQPLLSEVQAEVGAARTAADRRREDEVAQRDAQIQAFLMNLSQEHQLELNRIIMENQNDQAALDRELSRWLQENAQEWQGAEAEIQRQFTQMMTREGFAHDIEMLERQQAFQREMQKWSQTHEQAMVELAQEFQRIENQTDRDFQSQENAKERAFNTWLAKQDDAFRRWATEYEADLRRELQSNEFRQQHEILDKQQVFQRELTELAQQHDLLVQENQFTHDAAQRELDRSLTERINDRNITSQEGIEAARLQLAQLEADRGYELSQARLALDQLEQDLRIRITDDEEARYTYEGMRDQLAGYEGDPNNPEIQEIMNRARGHFGHSSQYYLLLESQAVALGSPAGVDARRAREANIALTESQTAVNEVQAALGGQEIEHREWAHSRAKEQAVFEDVESVRSALFSAATEGDVATVEYYKALQDNPDMMLGLSEEMQNAILNYDIDFMLDEARANLAAIGGEREWAVRQREMAEDRHAADMDMAEQELLQGKITTVDMQRAQANLMSENAYGVASTFVDQAAFDQHVQMLRSPQQAEHLARLGGEVYIAELEAAFANQQLQRSYDDRQQIARLFLETPLVDGSAAEVEAWKNNAVVYLQELYPSMAADEAQVIAERLTSEEFDRRLFREFDIEQALIDLSSAEGVSGPEYNEISLAIDRHHNQEIARLKAEYGQCYSQPEDMTGRTAFGENVQCTDEDLSEIRARLDQLGRNVARWNYELLGILPTDAGSEGFSFRDLPEAAQDELDAAFATQIPYAPPEGATEAEAETYALWYANEQQRWFNAMVGGEAYVPRDYQYGEPVRVRGENDLSTPKRMDNWLGNAIRGVFGPDPIWQRIGLIREGSFWYEPDLDADVDRQVDEFLDQLGGGGSGNASAPPSGGVESDMPDSEPVQPASGVVRGSAPAARPVVGAAMQRFRDSGFGFLDPRAALGDDYAAAAANSPTIRHNNPGALMFAGQAGAVSAREHTGDPSVRNWAHFDSMEDGFQAILNQQVLYAENQSAATRGMGRSPTIAEMVDIYAPPNENSPASRAGYVTRIVRNLADAGVSATGSTPLKEITDDPDALVALGLAMASFEMGENFNRVFVPDVRVMADAGDSSVGSMLERR